MKSERIIYTYLLAILIATLFLSCEGFHEAIVPLDVVVEDVETVLVINARIEEDQKCLVQISYSEDIDALVGTPVHYEENARVILTTDSGETEELRYVSYGYYYGSQISGTVEESYTLKIVVNGDEYSAVSTMLSPPGYQSAWVNSKADLGKAYGYSDEWIVNDPSNMRNRYLFQWWTNGKHIVRRDWAIDDNRVVNANEGLRLFNVTADPGPNEYTMLRAAEIDKPTYDYFNIYEKIVRGLLSVASQTPYNPSSNFGQGTIGNFRAIAFSSAVLLTPPPINATEKKGSIEISFPLNDFFTRYNLYWQVGPEVNKESTVIKNIKYSRKGDGGIFIHHPNVTDTLFYRLEVEDAKGNKSVLSPEVSSVGSANTGGPSNVKATPGKGSITLTWDAVDGVTAYVVYWSTKPGVTEADKYLMGKDSKKTIYTHTDLKTGQIYYYRIGAFFSQSDGSKEIVLSEEISGIPD